ncbi:GNAT family N-acetyltransferase [Candidatus Woesearchaeota archaeon]|nr:GNAT family N-acetyltransferase [Candidatus Woesearchaeota archaeon]
MIRLKKGLRKEDYQTLFEFYRDVDTIKYFRIADKLMKFSSAGEMKRHFDSTGGLKLFGIYQNKDFIGYLVLNKDEIGIYLGKKYNGKGHGTDAMKLFLNKLFKQGFKKIKLDTCTENKHAICLYEKIGFRIVKKTKNDRKILVKKGNKWISKKSGSIYFEIKRKEFSK